MEAVGLDVRLFLAQVITFISLLLILSVVMYKPLTNLLNKRREDIEKSLEQQKEIQERLETIQAYHKEQIIKTKNEAQKILVTAKENAEKERTVQIVRTQKEINALFEKAQKEIEAQKQEMIKSVDKKMAELLVPAIERILQESTDEQTKQQLYQRSLEKIQQMYPQQS